MYIKYRLTDKDREELEKMILLELAMPKYIERIGERLSVPNEKQNRRKT